MTILCKCLQCQSLSVPSGSRLASLACHHVAGSPLMATSCLQRLLLRAVGQVMRACACECAVAAVCVSGMWVKAAKACARFSRQPGPPPPYMLLLCAFRSLPVRCCCCLLARSHCCRAASLSCTAVLQRVAQHQISAPGGVGAGAPPVGGGGRTRPAPWPKSTMRTTFMPGRPPHGMHACARACACCCVWRGRSGTLACPRAWTRRFGRSTSIECSRRAQLRGGDGSGDATCIAQHVVTHACMHSTARPGLA